MNRSRDACRHPIKYSATNECYQKVCDQFRIRLSKITGFDAISYYFLYRFTENVLRLIETLSKFFVLCCPHPQFSQYPFIISALLFGSFGDDLIEEVSESGFWISIVRNWHSNLYEPFK